MPPNTSKNPFLEIKGQPVFFEKVTINKKTYWIATVKTNELSIDINSFKSSPFSFLKPASVRCEGVML